MNKKLIALAGLLAACGFMTGCSKKNTTKSAVQRNNKQQGKQKKAKRSQSKKAGRFNHRQAEQAAKQ